MNAPSSLGIDRALVLIEFAQEYGLAAEDCLDGTGLAHDALGAPDAQTTAAQEAAIAANLVRLLPHRPDLGLLVGERLHAAGHGSRGPAPGACATLGEAVERAERAECTSASAWGLCAWSVERAGATVALRARSRHLPRPVRRFALDRDLARLALLARRITGEAPPPAVVRTRHSDPDHAEAYLRVLGVVPEFGADRDEVVVDARALEHPPARSGPRPRVHRDVLRAEPSRRLSEPDLVARVREHIEADLAAADLESAARALAVSPRTLRRHLSGHGYSFRRMLDAARQDRALLLLRQGLATREIAGRLGYTEPSAFLNAFRRWTGTTPGRLERPPHAAR
ncbi:AraC family transcriptional regulator [Nocardiopsis halophila]|uniref:AraC family transcriptional regulator n=1 Tax=Nocardiopsis halophila TaxID=141692 RepID=UPI000348DFDA|nr:AraC family transcriptional regulator [Nocardiopsis halophila]